MKNDLAEWGYNRDKKAGKKQVVVGLLCDEEGEPVSIEVFKGNSRDFETFGKQIKTEGMGRFRFNSRRRYKAISYIMFYGDGYQWLGYLSSYSHTSQDVY